jgi:hypothetical protein
MGTRNRISHARTAAWLAALLLCLGAGADGPWDAASANGEISRQAFVKCLRFVQGWLQTADPETGLFARNLKDSPYWNARDAAADNYPFMVLTTRFTDRTLFEGRMRDILATEQRLCNRLDRLPDDWSFETRAFRVPDVKLDELIFGASEYMKDGLVPVTELLGPSPWSERMLGMLDDVWKHAAVETEVGKLPSASHEVAGDLLQVCSRMFWMTGNGAYRQYAFQLGDYFLLHHLPTGAEQLRLDDHGCEVINGLSEAYFIAAKTDPEMHAQWKAPMHKMLDRILEVARDENGLFYNLVNPVTGEIKSRELTDNWGYDYNAFAVVAKLDDAPRYREAVEFVLSHLLKAKDYKWEKGGSDGYADSLEGGLNLINRFPVPEAIEWADYVAQFLLAKPRDTGIIEGWHGDGNFARTALMYAFWKTQGAWAEPWRNDLRVGAVRREDGTTCFSVESDWPWKGKLRFDIPRHAEYLRMPEDYPRLNQFPEWFTVTESATYTTADGKTSGKELRGGLDITVAPKQPFRIQIKQLP